MTYLATEMLLYLLAAAGLGLGLGWLIWGTGQLRKMDALRSDLTVMIDAEREAHHQTRLALDQADSKAKQAIETVKAEADHTKAELRQAIDNERRAAQETQAALERARAETEAAVQRGKASGQSAIDEAMKTASAEKEAASAAMAKEAQSRAQIEELRLLIGAEKLAAESARTELEKTRTEMQSTLDAERAAHRQAKVALDDIRATLTKTLGAGALGLPSGQDEPSASASSVQASGEWLASAAPIADLAPANGDQAPFSAMTDMEAAGEALNNPDLDEADIEDREDINLDLSSPIDVETALAAPELEPAADDEADREARMPLSSPPTDRIDLRPAASDRPERAKPPIFLDQRPDDVDDLQAIEGISPGIERQLHESGCYRYRQIANLTHDHIDWLAKEIDVTVDRIAAEGWVAQARRLEQAAIAEDGNDARPHALTGTTDRQNAAS